MHVSSSDAAWTRWDVLGVQDSKSVPCIVLIQKGIMLTQVSFRRLSNIMQKVWNHLILCFACAKRPDKRHKTVFDRPPWLSEQNKKTRIAKEYSSK